MKCKMVPMKKPHKEPGDMWIAVVGDKEYLSVIVPNGWPWLIDGPAGNCTRTGEPHNCWIRHGEPPNITVDKDGDTCAAGAGSIMAPEHNGNAPWHGFLRGGELVEA